MPTVRLGRYEAAQGRLPPVCMVCGTRARIRRRKVFSHWPWWFYIAVPIGFLPFLVLLVFIARRALIQAPLCALHAYHWWWRNGLVALALGANLGLGLLALWLTEDPQAILSEGQALINLLWLLALVFVPVSVVGLELALRLTGIHARDIGEHSFTLGGVAAEFAEAVQVAHRIEAETTTA